MTKLNGTVMAERVRFMFNYNPATGDLTWRNPLANNLHAGQVAGTVQANGRRYIKIDGDFHLAHRIVWLFVYGNLPDENITAKNGDYTDIRLDNLARQSFSETASKGRRRTNTSGLKGVSWDKTKKKWQATITKDYKQHHLGRFDTKEDAAAAYEAASRLAYIGIRDEGRGARQSKIAKRALIRRLWRRTIRENGGVVGWDSYETFVTSVEGLPLTKDSCLQNSSIACIGPSNFSLGVGAPRARFNYKTPEGKRAYDRDSRAKNRDRHKNYELKKAFGITINDYRRMLSEQNGVCAVCKKPETEVRRGKLQTLSVDHCHVTNVVRSLLCGYCNRAIGYLKDDPEIIRSAAQYVEFHAASIAEQQQKSSVASNVIQLKKER